MALANVLPPGYRAFVARQQMNEQAPLAELQQAQGAMGLMAAIEQKKKEAALQEVLQQSGGDPEKAVEALVRSGNVEAAQRLTPLAKMAQERREREETRRGLAALMAPEQVAAAPGATAPQPSGNRIEALKRMSVLYANNPVVMQRIQAEIDKLQTVADRPPQRRERIDRETMIQEEFRDNKWQEIGRGPRFARQVTPVAPAKPPASTEDTEFTRDALELRARQYLSGDPRAMANLGRGAQGSNRIIQITNRAAAILREQGGTPEEIGRRMAEFRANSNSLNKLTQNYDAVTAFEQTAVRNGKILMDLADKVDSTGVPVVERWIRAGRKEVAGDPDIAAFNAQLQVYRTEAARILTNPNLGGQLTDSARKEVEEFLKPGASAQQIKKVVNLLERDFANRKQTLEEQMRAIRTRLEKNVSAGEPEQPAPASPAPGGWTPEKERRYQELLRKRGS